MSRCPCSPMSPCSWGEGTPGWSPARHPETAGRPPADSGGAGLSLRVGDRRRSSGQGPRGGQSRAAGHWGVSPAPPHAVWLPPAPWAVPGRRWPVPHSAGWSLAPWPPHTPTARPWVSPGPGVRGVDWGGAGRGHSLAPHTRRLRASPGCWADADPPSGTPDGGGALLPTPTPHTSFGPRGRCGHLFSNAQLPSEPRASGLLRLRRGNRGRRWRCPSLPRPGGGGTNLPAVPPVPRRVAARQGVRWRLGTSGTCPPSASPALTPPTAPGLGRQCGDQHGGAHPLGRACLQPRSGQSQRADPTQRRWRLGPVACHRSFQGATPGGGLWPSPSPAGLTR